MNACTLITDDGRKILKAYQGQADLILTSPPYADARKKHYDSVPPDQYAEWFLTFHEAFWNALREDGSLVINIKDKVVNRVRHRYVWQTILKLAEAGWQCIDDYIWVKANPMPGYWPTRLRDGWDYCFHLSKIKKPYINQEAVRVPVGSWAVQLKKSGLNSLTRHQSANNSGFGRNVSKWIGKSMVLPSNVIYTSVVGSNKKHPAVFPLALPSFFIKLLSRKDSLVIDPFAGSGTTGVATLNLQRNVLLIDNNPVYCTIARERLAQEVTEHPCQIVLHPQAFCSFSPPNSSEEKTKYD